MGCNCGQGAAPVEHIYVAPNGKVTAYKSAVQAQAAKIRNGGKGTVSVRQK